MRLTAFIFALVATIAASTAFADEGGNGGHDDSHERLGEARRHGKIMPIELLLKLLRERVKGEIVEIELDDKDDGLYYEIYYLDAEGRRIEIYVDAATGRIVKGKADD